MPDGIRAIVRGNALVGVLVREGRLALDEPLRVPEWSASPASAPLLATAHRLDRQRVSISSLQACALIAT
jgi:hypothetical protein